MLDAAVELGASGRAAGSCWGSGWGATGSACCACKDEVKRVKKSRKAPERHADERRCFNVGLWRNEDHVPPKVQMKLTRLLLSRPESH